MLPLSLTCSGSALRSCFAPPALRGGAPAPAPLWGLQPRGPRVPPHAAGPWPGRPVGLCLTPGVPHAAPRGAAKGPASHRHPAPPRPAAVLGAWPCRGHSEVGAWAPACVPHRWWVGNFYRRVCICIYISPHTRRANPSVGEAKNTSLPGWVTRCCEVAPSEAMFLPIIFINLLSAKPPRLTKGPNPARCRVRGAG